MLYHVTIIHLGIIQTNSFIFEFVWYELNNANYSIHISFLYKLFQLFTSCKYKLYKHLQLNTYRITV